jgi:hypothetical protein
MEVLDMVSYPIPGHCESGIIFEEEIMLIFSPITLPFPFVDIESNADDFFTDNCLDCSLRSTACKSVGPGGSCILGHEVKCKRINQTIQMSFSSHILTFGPNVAPRFLLPTDNDNYLAAMKLGNIYNNGEWCSGNVNYERKNPTSIYTGYMNSFHNNDLTDYGGEGYAKYVKQVSLDFTKIRKGRDPISLNEWGKIRQIVHNPKTVHWQSDITDNYFYMRNSTYGLLE